MQTPVHISIPPTVLELRNYLRTIAEHPQEPFSALAHQKIEQLQHNPQFSLDCSALLNQALEHVDFASAFAQYGLQSNREFFAEIYRSLKHKILPDLVLLQELKAYIQALFQSPKDLQWLQKLQMQHWESLGTGISPTAQQKITNHAKHALLLLSHRVVNIGIDPYLVKKIPQSDDSSSPFFELHQHIQRFTEDSQSSTAHIQQLLNACTIFFQNIETQKDQKGISLHLTFLLNRGIEHIQRMEQLLPLCQNTPNNKVWPTALIQLFSILIPSVAQQNHIGHFIQKNAKVLAYRIANHTSEKGEHYVGFTKEENKSLFKSALGGGLVVVALVYLKNAIHHLHLSLFFEGLLFGLNYGLGFVAMHFLHFTLATKQPAMTASYIANNLVNNRATSKKIFKQIVNSQLVSLVGNILMVLPICYTLALLAEYLFKAPVFSADTAQKQMYSNHPLLSLSLFYAAITGVYLSLSGWLTGYIDNKVIFSNIAQRISAHPWWNAKTLPQTKTYWGLWVQKNAGPVLGSLFLGFCLGMAGNLGTFLGLPYDIRHITISAGNFGIALGSFPHFPWQLIFGTLAGVFLIGLTNIFVSFLISFIVACQSVGLSWKESVRLLFSKKVLEN